MKHIMRPAKPIVPAYIVFLLSASIAYIVLFSALTSTMQTASMYSHLSAAQQLQNEAILQHLRGPFFQESTHEFLTSAENAHMTDVKELFDSFFIMYMIAFGIVIGTIGVFLYNKWWNRLDELLGRTLRAAGWALLAICFLLTAAVLLNFMQVWLIFHAILFPQGNWAFPASSTLITLYPSEFFENIVLKWLFLVTSFGIVAIILSYFLDRMRRHDQFFTQKYEQKVEKEHKHRKQR
jgi:integral membrane protein (TIGR01906 family)